jgi:transcriptional regulator with XRE-family HTH domain
MSRRGEAGTGLDFGAAVRDLRLKAGLSLNELARRAGVDPAYIHRIEARRREHAPAPRRGVVLAIAAALDLDPVGSDTLLAQAGYLPQALVDVGGWDPTLAQVAERLADTSLSGPARAELRELLRLIAHRWARSAR